jgi:hypothetical protein
VDERSSDLTDDFQHRRLAATLARNGNMSIGP